MIQREAPARAAPRTMRAVPPDLPGPFGYCVEDVVDQDVERRIDVVELWSGVASIAKAARARSLAAETFDIADDPEQDILKKSGFNIALDMVLRIRPGGLLWMAPVCSSFCWLSLSQTKRTIHNDFVGDVTNEKVKSGNAGADVAAFLFRVARSRGVEVCIENPPGSTIWKYPAIHTILSRLPLKKAIANRCHFDTKPFGKRYLKEYKFWGSGDWVEDLNKKCRCPNKLHKKTVKKKGTAITGRTADLKATQSYPGPLGKAIVDAWLKADSAPTSAHLDSCDDSPRLRAHRALKDAGDSEDANEDSDDESPMLRPHRDSEDSSPEFQRPPSSGVPSSGVPSSGVPPRSPVETSSDESENAIKRLRSARNACTAASRTKASASTRRSWIMGSESDDS